MAGRRSRLVPVLCLMLCGAALLCSGCFFAYNAPFRIAYNAPFRPPAGVLFTQVCAPLSVDFRETPVCSKRGTATSFFVRDIFVTRGLTIALRDCDIADAARNGGLTVVEYADYEYMQIVGLVCFVEVRAYGR
jgi:hypothetical protein